MTKPCPPDLAAFKHEPADYEQPVEAVTPWTPGPWSIYAQPINGIADAILELIEQVQATDHVGSHLYLINAGGKCPALTGCGPTSEANARLIAAAPALYGALEAAASLLPAKACDRHGITAAISLARGETSHG